VENGKRLRTPAAAEYLGIGESTLVKGRMTGNGPVYSKLGRICVYSIEDLDEYAEARRRRSTSEPAPATASWPRGNGTALDLTLPVEELEFATRVENALLADGIETLHKLLGKTEAELLGVPNLGKVSLAEIKSTLRKRRLRLGIELWPPQRLPQQFVPGKKRRG
jgi:DNA-directed RNA polymerase alpha subunit